MDSAGGSERCEKDRIIPSHLLCPELRAVRKSLRSTNNGIMEKVQGKKQFFRFLKNFFVMSKHVEVRPPKPTDNMSVI